MKNLPLTSSTIVFEHEFSLPSEYESAVYVVLTSFFICNAYTLSTYDAFSVLNALMYTFAGPQVSDEITAEFVFHFYAFALALSILLFLPLFSSQMVVKISSMRYSTELLWMIDYLNDIYKVNITVKDRRRLEILERFSFSMELVYKLGVCLYIVAGIAFLLNPIYMYWFRGEIVTLGPTFVPGIDEKTPKGYIAVTCFHLILIVFTVIASAATDFLFTLFVVNTPLLATLFRDEVNHLNLLLKDNAADSILVKFKLRNILLMHREIKQYDHDQD